MYMVINICLHVCVYIFISENYNDQRIMGLYRLMGMSVIEFQGPTLMAPFALKLHFPQCTAAQPRLVAAVALCL